MVQDDSIKFVSFKYRNHYWCLYLEPIKVKKSGHPNGCPDSCNSTIQGLLEQLRLVYQVNVRTLEACELLSFLVVN